MTAHLELTQSQAKGPLVIQGDQFGGLGLLLEGGRPLFIYNPTGRAEERLVLQAPAPLTAGAHDVRVRFAAKGDAPRAAALELSVDGQSVASADVPILYRARGDAYIGRKGVGSFLADRELGELTEASLRSVDIDVGK
jgi:arylsulfatase